MSIISFNKKSLEKFANLKPGLIERIESIEMTRLNIFPFKMSQAFGGGSIHYVNVDTAINVEMK